MNLRPEYFILFYQKFIKKIHDLAQNFISLRLNRFEEMLGITN